LAGHARLRSAALLQRQHAAQHRRHCRPHHQRRERARKDPRSLAPVLPRQGEVAANSVRGRRGERYFCKHLRYPLPSAREAWRQPTRSPPKYEDSARSIRPTSNPAHTRAMTTSTIAKLWAAARTMFERVRAAGHIAAQALSRYEIERMRARFDRSKPWYAKSC